MAKKRTTLPGFEIVRIGFARHHRRGGDTGRPGLVLFRNVRVEKQK